MESSPNRVNAPGPLAVFGLWRVCSPVAYVFSSGLRHGDIMMKAFGLWRVRLRPGGHIFEYPEPDCGPVTRTPFFLRLLFRLRLLAVLGGAGRRHTRPGMPGMCTPDRRSCNIPTASACVLLGSCVLPTGQVHIGMPYGH